MTDNTLAPNASVKDSITWAAAQLGVDATALATVISYESAGTFSPSIRGPRTHRGQHIGLIQFGEAEQKQYGAHAGQTVAEQMGAVVRYMQHRGVTPGMSLLDIYSTVNAGSPGRYNASDTAAGGAPGTVRDKVQSRAMLQHGQRAAAIMGGELDVGMFGAGGRQREALSREEMWNTSANDYRERTRAARRAALEGALSGPTGKPEKRVRAFDGAVEWAAATTAAAGADPTDMLAATAGREAEVAGAVLDAGAAPDVQIASQEMADQQAAVQAERNAKQQDASFGDKFNYLWRENSITGAFVDWTEHGYAGDKTADPTFKYVDHMEALEAGRTMKEIEELRKNAGTSLAQLEHMRADQDRRREAAKVMQYSSTGEQLGIGLLAGIADPAGWLAGFGVYKAMHVVGVGARAAMLAGNLPKGFALAGVEGAVGNVLATAGIDALNGRQSTSDYVMAAGFGFALGVPSGLFDLKDARMAASVRELRRLSDQLSEDAAARAARFNHQAAAELGPNATPEAISARSMELEAEATRRDMEELMNDVPDEDRLQPRRVDEEEQDAPKSRVPDDEEDLDYDDSEIVGQRDDDSLWDVAPSVNLTPEEIAKLREESDASWRRAMGELHGTGAVATPKEPVYRGAKHWRTPPEFADQYGNDIRIKRVVEKELAGDAVATTVVRAIGSIQTLRADQRLLATKIADVLDKLDTRLMSLEEAKKVLPPDYDMTGIGGLFFPRENGLYIAAATPEVVIHEALHAATAAAMRMSIGPGATMRRGLEKILPQIREVLRERRFDEKLFTPAERMRMRSQAYNDVGAPASSFLDNVDELLAYGMTNPTVQGILQRIKAPAEGKGYTGRRNAWQWFKDMVAEVMGLQDKKYRSMLDELLDIASDGLDGLARGAGADGNAPRSARTGTLQDYPMAHTMQAVPATRGALLQTRAQVRAVADKYGLTAGITDPVERALAAEMYARAEQALAKINIDEARLKPLLSAVGWEATTTRMLLSKNPLMRATAALLLENPEGAAGRRPSAAILAKMNYMKYMNTAEPHYEGLLNVWAQRQGIGKLRSHLDKTVKERFDTAVSQEMHARWMGTTSTTDPAITKMADILDAGFSRMGAEFAGSGAIGGKRIPVGRSGYMPRQLLGARVAQLTVDQRNVVQKILADDLASQNGFDPAFSKELASKILERSIDKATQGWMVSMDLRSPDTADIVLDSLRALGLGGDQLQKIMGRFSRGGANFTKSRLDLDLNTPHTMPDGSTFRLGDLYSHDVLGLYKQYARRVGGEVALARYGVQGSPGIKEMRVAMRSAGSEYQATGPELEAFDQAMSEILGTSVGTRTGVWGDNFRSLVSSTFLGGMGWTQLAESGNAIHAVGAMGLLRATVGGRRLLSEVRALGKGEAVDNPLLKSLEVYTGGIGADQYRVLGLREVGDRIPTYGQEELGIGSLAVRGVGHAVRVLSMQRAIEAVQIRGMSEQIVIKMFNYIRDGGEIAALRDMGLTPQLEELIRAELGSIATWNGGKLAEVDITKLSSPAARQELATVVERGASQIIQRTYAGEVGKWAHNDYLLLLTQFRTYPMVATQKQWRRTAFTHGTAKAVGYVLGAASVAVPVYMARMALQSVGKDDGWLEDQLTLEKLGMAAARYTSGMGLTSDVLEGFAGMAGLDGMGPRGAGASGSIPAVGLVNDWGKALSWSGDPRKDLQEVTKVMPGNRIPAVQAALQELFSE